MSRGWEHVTPTDIARLQQRDVVVPTKPTKYRNQVTIIGDKRFDSKKEAEQWLILQTRECAGEITGLKRQVPYALFVGVLAPDGTFTDTHVQIGIWHADFDFFENGVHVVVDVKGGQGRKGTRTAVYQLKKRMLEAQRGIVIREV